MAGIAGTPAALIMQIQQGDVEMLVSSRTPEIRIRSTSAARKTAVFTAIGSAADSSRCWSPMRGSASAGKK